MPKENIIPKEYKKPVEIVYELKNEIPTFEEFMKTYKSDKNLNYDDLNGADIGTQKSYGPGNTQSVGEATKKVASVGLAISYFTPLSVVTVPASIGVGVAGLGAGIAGKLTDNDDLARVGGKMLEVVVDSVNPQGTHGEVKGLGDMIKYKTKK